MDKHQLLYEWAKRTVKASDSGDLSHLFTSTNVPFDQWMSENNKFLEDLNDKLIGFRIIENEEEYREWYLPPEDYDLDLCVFIDMNVPKDQLLKQFRRLLKEHHPGKAGRPRHRSYSEFEWCEISGKTTLDTLELMLKVYDLRETTSLRLWQIAEKLKMNPSKATKKTDTRGVLVEKKAILSSTVSRYLQWANKLMKNLEEGRFPKYR
ncbi:hypothetical protein LZ012_13885 [Dechloromonas sp. XY25]|uniref:J domain-containing protein n=1 Tax=Dechloromonas hankyongensis TaxID=2908002 RepID=A0ABS9K4K5_9RHOO|nr:hypothetical protein [Dechloromonas hankyongensis]MCG2578080.1 hypothetical protein [Dechloromonas hankyongensis]